MKLEKTQNYAYHYFDKIGLQLIDLRTKKYFFIVGFFPTIKSDYNPRSIQILFIPEKNRLFIKSTKTKRFLGYDLIPIIESEENPKLIVDSNEVSRFSIKRKGDILVHPKNHINSIIYSNGLIHFIESH